MNPLLLQFLTEARDFLEKINEKLIDLEADASNEALISEIFRAVHTLKGNSGLFSLPALTRLLHASEDLLDQVRDRRISLSSDLIDELLESTDTVLLMVGDIETTEDISSGLANRGSELSARLRSFLLHAESDGSGEPQSVELAAPDDWSWISALGPDILATAYDKASEKSGLWAVHYAAEPECYFKGEDPVLLIRTMPGLLGHRVFASEPWGDAAALDVYRNLLGFDAISDADEAALRDHFKYVPDQTALYQLPAHAFALPDGVVTPLEDFQAEFLDLSIRKLEGGNMANLVDGIDVLLDMVNSESRLASGLTWAKRLIDAGSSPSVILLLLQSLLAGTTPDWISVNGLAGPKVEPARSKGLPDEPVIGTSSRQDPAAGLRRSILLAQVHILESGMSGPGAVGKLHSVINTMRNLLSGADDAAPRARMEQVIAGLDGDDLQQALISFLTDQSEVDDVATPKAEFNDTPMPAPESLAEKAVPAGEPDIGQSSVTGSARPGEAQASEKIVRVLKVPQEKIDRLMDLIGEMVVAKNALPYLAARAENEFGCRELSREIKSQYAIINRIAEDMQHGIMQVRMLPVGAIFQRFPRLVRDVAKQLGKRVRLQIDGEDTEADKNIIESLSDPLIHILRNSLDHGLELPQERERFGKHPEGSLHIAASQEGDRVVIAITDDGRGINPQVVKRKALEKGLIDSQRFETISDVDAVQLVFAPGFSTASVVSDLSGRGVGMDVVKNSVEKAGGQVQLTSEPGKGTEIRLSLPLSMSVSNVMMVDIAGQRFGVPMDLIVETVRISTEEIHVFKQQKTAVLRGKIIPIYDSHALLGLAEKPRLNDADELAVLVVRLYGETIGLAVDDFAQTTDVILKPLEGPLSNLSGFSGSALLGDGNVLLVLNLKELL